MKKLILILTLVLMCLCIIACIPKKSEGTRPGTTAPGSSAATPPVSTPASQPETSVPDATEPAPEGWYEAEGLRYYYENGQYLTGWQTVDGLYRYFLPNGALAQGFADVGDARYYFDENGCTVTGWLDVDGKRYYLSESGAVHTGWLQQADVLYYFREDGRMARGCVEIDGVNTYFTSTGAYILVLNPWNSLPEGYEPDLVYIGEDYAGNRRVDSICRDALVEMMQTCAKEAHQVYVLSGYRTVTTQEKLYKQEVSEWKALGYSQEEAEYLAAQVVAVPGTSEHHSGLAVDIIDTSLWALEEAQENLSGQKWLMEHCWEYGFILRYPKDKTDVTGIIYEPWHYRYVGKELAAELHQLGLTLEEYLDMLTETEKTV